MFFDASPAIFKYAYWLRNNMTEPEKLIWEKLRNNNLGFRFKARRRACLERALRDQASRRAQHSGNTRVATAGTLPRCGRASQDRKTDVRWEADDVSGS